MPDKPKIGFIGLGIMGRPMAFNILRAGYPLSVYNRTPEKMKDIGDAGAYKCKNYEELSGRSAVIITMLPDSPEVEQVILDKNFLFPHLREGTTIIDMSSIAPLVSQKIAVQLQKKEVKFLDAPVSGGEPGAVEGTLAIMVGGEEVLFKDCLPVLETMGKNIVRVGPVGSGGLTKLVNQIIVALNIAAMGEAFTLAQKAGLSVENVFQAIRGGLAGSRVLDAKSPLVLQRKFQPGFKIKLHRKDLKNALQTGQDLNVELPLTSTVQNFIQNLCDNGKEDLDHSAIVQYFEQLSGVTIGKQTN